MLHAKETKRVPKRRALAVKISGFLAKAQQSPSCYGKCCAKKDKRPIGQREAENRQFRLLAKSGSHEQLRESITQPFDELFDQPGLPSRAGNCPWRLSLQPALISSHSDAASRNGRAQHPGPTANGLRYLPGSDPADQDENHE